MVKKPWRPGQSPGCSWGDYSTPHAGPIAGLGVAKGQDGKGKRREGKRVGEEECGPSASAPRTASGQKY